MSHSTQTQWLIGVIGGGINGLCIAWELARRGHDVHLFERDTLLSQTSSASTKLLHGGLRYLENGELRLVREALAERRQWVNDAPDLAYPISLLYPVYAHGRRARWQVKLGLWLYDRLAGAANLGRHTYLDRPETLAALPTLNPEGLLGSFRFFDGQMDDLALGQWVASQARNAGVSITEHCPVKRVTVDGEVFVPGGSSVLCHRVVNVTGPWAAALLQTSGIDSDFALDLVRGSHLIIDRPCSQGAFLEVPGSRRIVFALPWKGRTLLGTTEARQTLDTPIECSAEEQAYLISVYNQHFTPGITAADIIGTFAGVRPLLRSADDPSRATREYQLETRGALTTVFGGKWTTARALARRTADQVLRPID